MRLLLLGGTTEANRLAAALATRPGVDAILSLAGRTAAPAAPAIPVRVGGFGGAAGLADYLRDHRIDVLIDATHPFAARISANALAASRLMGVPLLGYSRPPWIAGPEDCWTSVSSIAAVVTHLGALPARSVFLTTGRQDLAAFRAAPQHRYLVRTIDPPSPEGLPPQATIELGRGPFAVAEERALMQTHAVQILVTKNSGGAASEAKLEAVRDLGIPVLMIARPPLPPRPECHALDDVLTWIARHAASPR